MKSGKTGFVDSRNFRRGSEALVRRNCIGTDLAGLDLRHGVRRLIDDEIDLTGHEVEQRRASAAIRNELEFGADQLAEIDAREMRARTDTRSAGGRLAIIGFK